MLKQLAYYSGGLSFYHHLYNRSYLTIAMFHRVLAKSDPRWRTADPNYTVSVEIFEGCLHFFRRHYNLVSASSLVASTTGGCILPTHPLLITFDDGWADNFEYALPLLEREGFPSVVFVVPDAISDEEAVWWQEIVYFGVRTGRITDDDITFLWRSSSGHDVLEPSGDIGERMLALIARFVALPPETRLRLLQPFADRFSSGKREILSVSQLRHLAERVTIGSHGETHAPLPLVGDCCAELKNSRNAVARLLGTGYKTPLDLLSFPHGRYDPRVISAARATGFRLMMTSDRGLNPLHGGRLQSDVLARIPIVARQISDETGRLSPEALANWLFTQPSYLFK